MSAESIHFSETKYATISQGDVDAQYPSEIRLTLMVDRFWIKTPGEEIEMSYGQAELLHKALGELLGPRKET